MKFYKTKFQFLLILLPVLLIFLPGCSLLNINKQAAIVENAGTIKGSVINSSDQTGPIIVTIFQKQDEFLVNKIKFKVPENGSFRVTVLPDEYMVATYVDSNKNNKYDIGEAGKFYSSSSIVNVAEKQEVTLTKMHIVGPPKTLPENIKPVSGEKDIVKNIGKLTTLDNPTFITENYSMGMWRPLDFIDGGNGGVFFLSPYKKTKTPVLFIHGIGGGPTDFKDVIAVLDKDRFQPIVVYYPSGLRLNIVSDYLSKAVSDLQTKYRFNKMIVVAHSMGGLVSRSFIKKYHERYPRYAKAIQLYMTINSPMQGISSLSSIDYYPVVVPVWRDLVPGSSFIQELHEWRLPKSIKYHMIFSFKKGKANDGVVSIVSQLPYNLQNEAVRVYGFNTNHIGPLHDEKPLAIVKSIIEHGDGRYLSKR